VGVGVSIQLYEAKCLTQVIDATGGVSTSRRSWRDISAAIVADMAGVCGIGNQSLIRLEDESGSGLCGVN